MARMAPTAARRTKSVELVRLHRNARVPEPTQTPATVPSSAHCTRGGAGAMGEDLDELLIRA